VAQGGRRSGRERGGRATGPAPGAKGARPGAPARRERGNRGPLVRDVSAGGVVFRRTEGAEGVAIALVGRLRPPRWALPKGTPRAGETLEETAVREVSEETGLQARVVQPLERIEYWFAWGGVRHFKIVHFYLMEMVGGDTAHHDGEYDVVEWFSVGEGLRLLSYPNEVRVVEKAQQVLAAG
jgi:8-oxo-dGTP pyrophosphatase MutT (NUDIX family)